MRNKLKTLRAHRRWSQAELASQAGISRTAVTAIEGNKLVPSVAAALSLAAALDCTVEELFGLDAPRSTRSEVAWAWSRPAEGCRYWQAKVGSRTLLYPVEPTALATGRHDGVCTRVDAETSDATRPEETLVVATCDPAAGLLASEFA